MNTGDQIIKRFQRLEQDMESWRGHWQELAEYVQPRKAQAVQRNGANTPDTAPQRKLFDTTGVLANLTSARGQIAWMTPSWEKWFSLGSRKERDGLDDETISWLNECSERMHDELEQSNFYLEIHELYLDRTAFGTGNLFCDWDPEANNGLGGLFFKNHSPGCFVCAQDAWGRVDEVGVKHHWSAIQAVGFFNLETDQLPPEVLKKANSPKDQDGTEEYVHLVYPRKHRGKTPLAKDKPFASCWIHCKTKTVIRESGFDALPYYVTRFLEWKRFGDGSSPYGQSPTWDALGELRQLNLLEAHLDALAGRQVNPPMIIPTSMQDRLDLRDGGRNYVADELFGNKAWPQPMFMGGSYQLGVERAEHKREMIRKAFMVDLFQMFAQLDPNKMTATEVNARLSEKIEQFSPTFQLFSTELLKPMLTRIFWLMANAGRFSNPPATMGVQVGENEWTLDPRRLPSIQFNSRAALAMELTRTQGGLRALEVLVGAANIKPHILDNIDEDAFARNLWRVLGGNEDELRPIKEMKRMREEQRALMEEQRMLEAAKVAA